MERRPTRTSVLWLLAAVSCLIVGLSWAVAYPPAGAPDDDFHLGSIWCAWGDAGGLCREINQAGPAYSVVSVPPLARLRSCFAYQQGTSAACQFAEPASDDERRANVGGYPGGYYSVMRLFASEQGLISVLLMRIVSWVLCLAMLGVGAWLLGKRQALRVGLYWLIVSVPLGLFLYASNNPSGVAIAAEAATFAATLATFRSSTTRRALGCGALAALFSLTAIVTRPDGLHFSLAAVVIAGLLGLRAAPWWGRHAVPLRVSASRLQPVVLGLIPLVSVLLLAVVTRNPSGEAFVTSASGHDQTSVSALSNLGELPRVYVGPFATTLGWLDTPMPALVWVPGALVLGAIVAIGLRQARSRRLVVAGLLVMVMAAVPTALLQAGDQSVGHWVQPRYLFSLLLILVAVFAVNLRSDRVRLAPAQAWGLAIVAVAVHAVALHQLMLRFIVGLDGASWNLEDTIEWWWPGAGPFGPNVIWLTGSIAFAVLVSILASSAGVRRHGRGERTPSPVRSSTRARDEQHREAASRRGGRSP